MIGGLLKTEFTLLQVISRGDEVLPTLADTLPEALVLDVSLPGCSGLQLLPALRSAHPTLAIIILTTHESSAYRREATKRGADAYIVKGSGEALLLREVRRAIASRQELR